MGWGELLTLLEAGKRTPRDAMQLCYPEPAFITLKPGLGEPWLTGSA